MRNSEFAFWIFGIIRLGFVHCSENPILPTTHGYIKGVQRTTIYGDTYYSFEKIPYARPPIGKHRFRAPEILLPWANILDCSNFSEKPLQKNSSSGEIEGSEDCLYLNVYVKKLHTDKPLPVMIYIYGGGFQTGEATRNALAPDYFMKEDVILVTLNYRLGALGFLWFKDASLKIPGNAALKDQLAALRWFKHNCINFNGDPNSITLFGNSAGGASVHYLMLTEKAKHLFNKAILMSGTVYNKYARTPGDYAYRLAKVNGYTGANNDVEVHDFLMQLEANQLVGHDLTTKEERLDDIDNVFGPTIESYIDEDTIIAKDPHELFENAWSNKIPVVISGTSFEGLKFCSRIQGNAERIQILEERPELAIPAEVRSNHTDEENRKLGQKIIKLHMGDSELTKENGLKYLSIYSYKLYWHGFYRSILSRLAYVSQSSTYLYRFDFDSPTFNFYRQKYCGSNVRGVAHADDLSYLFFGENSWKLDEESNEYKTIRRLISLYTSFARTSNPNTKEINPVVWEKVSREDPNRCLNISYNVSLIELPEADKLAVWNDLYPKNLLY